MSELLDDSPTAARLKDRIIAEIAPGERILFVTEGHVIEPWGGGPSNFGLYIGAIIVTSVRILSVESKMLGRAAFRSKYWRDVEKIGRYDRGEVGLHEYVHKSKGRPIWRIEIWEGKSHKSPLDMRRLDMLSLAMDEARSAVAAEMAAESADHAAQVADEYEQLKRRRGD